MSELLSTNTTSTIHAFDRWFALGMGGTGEIHLVGELRVEEGRVSRSGSVVSTLTVPDGEVAPESPGSDTSKKSLFGGLRSLTKKGPEGK